MKVFLMCLLVLSFARAQDVDYLNPGDWAGTCADGTKQSPIDIITSDLQVCKIGTYFHVEAPCQEFPYYQFGQNLHIYAPKLNEIMRTTMNVAEGAIEFWKYESSHITYHSPSEHTINGDHYDLEMQLHHNFVSETEESAQIIIDTIQATLDSIQDLPFDLEVKLGAGEGTKAVISLMFNVMDVDEDVFDSFIPQGFQDRVDDDSWDVTLEELATELSLAEDFASTFPTMTEEYPEELNVFMTNLRESFECISNKFFYHYEGSQTVPPCTENTEWFVLRDPLPIKQEHFDAITARINGGSANNRPTQSLNERKVEAYSEEQCNYYYSIINWQKYDWSMYMPEP